ncbi:MAG: hypothetical protein L0196_06025 [candidate division Zixibacteria bacterium]|nr:hypothetical protein [candidate division Zixibacteria bacterium]
MRKLTGSFLIILTALLVWQFSTFNVLQDDAFISFRYVRNFLDGLGLVFNIGERVEGYSNFLWIILLAFLAKLGLPLIETARSIGILAAIGTLGLCTYAARNYYPQRGWLWIAAAPFLLAANGALAYWAGSGLETSLFTFLAAAAAVTYFARPNHSLLLLALATLTRPEGGLLAFLFGISGILLKQKSWKATLTFWGGLALLLLPFAVFKWVYYGSLLPNPFYAKTGFSTEYLQGGLEYFGLFLKHYGGYGLFLLLPLLLWKKLSPFSRFSLLVFLGYTLYLIAIGGDVLKAHRFFVPILLLLYLPLTDGLQKLMEKRPRQRLVFAAAVFLVGLLSYRLPKSYLDAAAFAERGLVAKMGNLGRLFVRHDYAKSFAASTIGALAYYAGNRRVIDMLGLTEREVARNPEKIEGIVSSWKERHFNARHVLSQKPEVILFSTELKPSSPAERALFLYPEFRRNYRLEYLFGDGHLSIFYRKFKDYGEVTGPDQPARFVNLLNDGLNLTNVDNARAVSMLYEVISSGGADCPALNLMTGYLFSLAGQPESCETYLRKGLAMDGGGPLGTWYYCAFLYERKRYAEAVQLLSPMVEAHPTAEAFLESRGILRPTQKTAFPPPATLFP